VGWRILSLPLIPLIVTLSADHWKHALFLRRAETPDRKTLEYYLVELDGPGQPISMLKVWVGMVLLAEDDWFYASPTPSSAPLGRNFGTSTAAVNGAYQCLAIDFRLCCFDLGFVRRGVNGGVVIARFLPSSVGVVTSRLSTKLSMSCAIPVQQIHYMGKPAPMLLCKISKAR
jgi:hypothetical protein